VSDLSGLNGKILVVFGASGGIGKSICEIAKRFGAKVHGFSRANGVDVRERSEIRTALESAYSAGGHLDFIIDAAGILKLGELNEKSDGDIRSEIDTNYYGCINIAREARVFLKKSKGALLFFASSSYTRGRARYSIYSSTKAAVVNFTQALAEEWALDGIRVNAINPARTATPMRLSNFGNEEIDSLLSPEFVAEKSLSTLLQNYTGQIVDVRNTKNYTTAPNGHDGGGFRTPAGRD
jgi:2-C-methyl-D-erythritol 4-phosphate cytidylyltransferase